MGPGLDAQARTASEIAATLAAERWSPAGAELAMVQLPSRWWEGPASAQRVLEGLEPDSALFVATDPDGAELVVATGARNAANGELDAAGHMWPGRRLAPGGPKTRRCTGPSATLLQAIRAVGAPVREGGTPGAGVANRCLYAALARIDAPPLAFLSAPVTLETARALQRPTPSKVNRATAVAAVKAALVALAAVRAAAP